MTVEHPATRLHHHAYVVKDQEATRHFYEDILGMPLIATWCEVENVRGKERTYCHTFFELADGSSMAFFQFLDPEDGAELSLDTGASLNHVALNSTRAQQAGVKERLEASGFPYRTVDHGYCFVERPAYDADAAEASWAKVFDLFARNLK